MDAVLLILAILLFVIAGVACVLARNLWMACVAFGLCALALALGWHILQTI